MRACFIRSNSDIPKYAFGTCWPASGFADPESAQEGSYLFQPDGDEKAYYVEPERDLVILREEPRKPEAA